VSAADDNGDLFGGVVPSGMTFSIPINDSEGDGHGGGGRLSGDLARGVILDSRRR
jgi:hypothetical protein